MGWRKKGSKRTVLRYFIIFHSIPLEEEEEKQQQQKIIIRDSKQEFIDLQRGREIIKSVF